MKSKGKILLLILLGGALACSLPFLRKQWTATAFCDGFSLVGVLFLSYGGLLFLVKQDGFLGVSFLGERIKSYFLPFLSERKSERFEDFYNRRTAEKTASRNQSNKKSIYALLIGAGYLAVAAIFLFFI